MQNEDRDWEQGNEQESLGQGDDGNAGATAAQGESDGGDDSGDFDANPPIIISG